MTAGLHCLPAERVQPLEGGREGAPPLLGDGGAHHPAHARHLWLGVWGWSSCPATHAGLGLASDAPPAPSRPACLPQEAAHRLPSGGSRDPLPPLALALWVIGRQVESQPRRSRHTLQRWPPRLPPPASTSQVPPEHLREHLRGPGSLASPGRAPWTRCPWQAWHGSGSAETDASQVVSSSPSAGAPEWLQEAAAVAFQPRVRDPFSPRTGHGTRVVTGAQQTGCAQPPGARPRFQRSLLWPLPPFLSSLNVVGRGQGCEGCSQPGGPPPAARAESTPGIWHLHRIACGLGIPGFSVLSVC